MDHHDSLNTTEIGRRLSQALEEMLQEHRFLRSQLKNKEQIAADLKHQIEEYAQNVTQFETRLSAVEADWTACENFLKNWTHQELSKLQKEKQEMELKLNQLQTRLSVVESNWSDCEEYLRSWAKRRTEADEQFQNRLEGQLARLSELSTRLANWISKQDSQTS